MNPSKEYRSSVGLLPPGLRAAARFVGRAYVTAGEAAAPVVREAFALLPAEVQGYYLGERARRAASHRRLMEIPEFRARVNAGARERYQPRPRRQPTAEERHARHAATTQARRERLRTDPAWAERERQRGRDYRRNRYHADPEFRARHIAASSAAWKARYEGAPEFREKRHARWRERYWTDPEFRARVNAGSRERNRAQRARAKELDNV